MTDTTETPNMKHYLIGAPFAVAAVAAVGLYYGFVVQCLWSWFATPLGAPEMSLPGAVGAFILVRFMCKSMKPRKSFWTAPEDRKTFYGFVEMAAIRPTVVLAGGYVVEAFMP